MTSRVTLSTVKSAAARGAVVGACIGSAVGGALGAWFVLGWVICASTGSSCGDSAGTMLRAAGVTAACGATGATIGLALAAIADRLRKRYSMD
jgi:hypothetical protein